MRLRKNKCEFGKFGWLQAEEAQIEPAPGPSAPGAQKQNRNQKHYSAPICNYRPTRQGMVIDQAQSNGPAQSNGIPDDLAHPQLLEERSGAGGFTGHRSAVDEQRAQDHQTAHARQLQAVNARVAFVEDGVKHGRGGTECWSGGVVECWSGGWCQTWPGRDGVLEWWS